MALPTIEQMTNLYLYGSTVKPQNLESDNLIRGTNEVTNFSVDMAEYLDVLGRYVLPANFNQVDLFLSEGAGLAPGK
jgi:hypothetical protein